MKKIMTTILVATVLTVGLSAEEDGWAKEDIKTCKYVKNLYAIVYEGADPKTMKKDKDNKNAPAMCNLTKAKNILNFSVRVEAQKEAFTKLFGKFSTSESLLMGNKGFRTGIDYDSWLRQYNSFLCFAEKSDYAELKLRGLYSFLTFFPSAEFDKIYKKPGEEIEKNIVGRYNLLTSFISTFALGAEAYDDNHNYSPLSGGHIIKDLIFNQNGFFTNDVKYDPDLRVFIGAIAEKDYDKAWEIVINGSKRTYIGYKKVQYRCSKLGISF